MLKNGQKVAVKKLKANTRRGHAEVQMLSCLDHPNIIRMIGYHDKGDDLFIIYELMPLRSLDLHLYAVGVAKALEYLHDQKDPPVIYGDLKPSGILLDEKFNPKLSDSSLAKFGLTWDNSKAPLMLMGKFGYVAPEYGLTGMLTREYDIFGFGVVLLELITGHKEIIEPQASVKRSLVDWAQPFFRDIERFTEIADPSMEGCYPKCGLAQALAVAEKCMREYADERPLIADVLDTLSHLLS
ncbi:hypothetical protein MKX01_023450 [Papaver californicum]|nr:hypothetical protein MKX01_023450 [Papaver californicum]